MFLIPEDLHLLRYGKNNHEKMQLVKYGGGLLLGSQDSRVISAIVLYDRAVV